MVGPTPKLWTRFYFGSDSETAGPGTRSIESTRLLPELGHLQVQSLPKGGFDRGGTGHGHFAVSLKKGTT